MFFYHLRQVHRARVFLLAVRGDFHFQEPNFFFRYFSWILTTFNFDFCWLQDTALMTESQMMRQATRPWNASNKPPLHQWLSDTQTKMDQERLKCIGNTVLPKCGQLALHLLEHSFRSDPSRWWVLIFNVSKLGSHVVENVLLPIQGSVAFGRIVVASWSRQVAKFRPLIRKASTAPSELSFSTVLWELKKTDSDSSWICLFQSYVSIWRKEQCNEMSSQLFACVWSGGSQHFASLLLKLGIDMDSEKGSSDGETNSQATTICLNDCWQKIFAKKDCKI